MNVVTSAIFFYGVVCWGSSISTVDKKRCDKLVRKGSSAHSTVMESDSHLLQDTSQLWSAPSATDFFTQSVWSSDVTGPSSFPAAVRLMPHETKVTVTALWCPPTVQYHHLLRCNVISHCAIFHYVCIYCSYFIFMFKLLISLLYIDCLLLIFILLMLLSICYPLCWIFPHCGIKRNILSCL